MWADFLAALFQGSISSFLGTERQFGQLAAATLLFWLPEPWTATMGVCFELLFPGVISEGSLVSQAWIAHVFLLHLLCHPQHNHSHFLHAHYVSGTMLNVLHKSFYLSPKTTHEEGALTIPLFQMSFLRFRKRGKMYRIRAKLPGKWAELELDPKSAWLQRLNSASLKNLRAWDLLADFNCLYMLCCWKDIILFPSIHSQRSACFISRFIQVSEKPSI